MPPKSGAREGNAMRRYPRIILTAILLITAVSCTDDDNPVNSDDTGDRISIERTDWKPSSRPVQLSATEYIRGDKMLWHSVRDGIPVQDIWDRETERGRTIVRPLRIISRPDSIRIDTINDSIFLTEASKSFNGITVSIATDGYRYDADSFFELRTNTNRGILHIDIGTVSEDINGDSMNNTEDPADLDVALPENDYGLDGIPDTLEPGYDPITNPDPHGDNWYFDGYGDCPLPQSQLSHCNDDSLYYEWLNGTEGNIEDVLAFGQPDKEQFGQKFDTTNAYISYAIDLSDTVSGSTFYVHGSTWPSADSGTNPPDGFWRTWRIPFTTDQHELINLTNPLQVTLKHVRVWFEHAASGATVDTLLVAQWRIGSNE